MTAKTLTLDNVLTELEASINRYGGPDTIYTERLREQVKKVYSNTNDEEFDELSGMSDCYYATPGVSLTGDYLDKDIQPANPEPSCLIGCLLHDLGVPLSVFYATDNNSNVFELFSRDEIGEYVEADGPVRDVLNVAQKSQDTGSSWGQALESARSLVNAYLAPATKTEAPA